MRTIEQVLDALDNGWSDDNMVTISDDVADDAVFYLKTLQSILSDTTPLNGCHDGVCEIDFNAIGKGQDEDTETEA